MTYQLKTSTVKTALMTLGMLIGIVILAKGQDLNHIKKFSGMYILDDHGHLDSINVQMNRQFSILDNQGNQVDVQVHRLVDKINVIDVSTYFYEVTLKYQTLNQPSAKKTMEVIHNSESDLVLLDLEDFKTYRRVALN